MKKKSETPEIVPQKSDTGIVGYTGYLINREGRRARASGTFNRVSTLEEAREWVECHKYDTETDPRGFEGYVIEKGLVTGVDRDGNAVEWEYTDVEKNKIFAENDIIFYELIYETQENKYQTFYYDSLEKTKKIIDERIEHNKQWGVDVKTYTIAEKTIKKGDYSPTISNIVEEKSFIKP